MMLNFSSTQIRNQLYQLNRKKLLSVKNLNGALTSINIPPSTRQWQYFIDHFLLWLGSILMTIGGMFFFAYNWTALGKFTKFAMLEVIILVLMIWAVSWGWKKLSGRIALLVAASSVGVLLAVIGQAYHSSADSYQLFLFWSIALIPWAIIARFIGLWVMILILLNVSTFFYWQQYSDYSVRIWFTFGSLYIINSIAFFISLAVIKQRTWLIQLTYIATLFCLSVLYLDSLFNTEEINWYSSIFLYYPVFIGISIYYFQYKQRDILCLASNALSMITCISVTTVYIADVDSAGLIILQGLWVVAQASIASYWLRHIAKQWQLSS